MGVFIALYLKSHLTPPAALVRALERGEVLTDGHHFVRPERPDEVRGCIGGFLGEAGGCVGPSGRG
jgi:hypothetical protein